MIAPPKMKRAAPGAKTEAAREVRRGQQPRQQCTQSPTCGKQAALALYNHGLLPLERVELMFQRNPRWRAA